MHSRRRLESLRAKMQSKCTGIILYTTEKKKWWSEEVREMWMGGRGVRRAPEYKANAPAYSSTSPKERKVVGGT